MQKLIILPPPLSLEHDTTTMKPLFSPPRKNQSSDCSLTLPVNLFYHSAINISVDEVITGGFIWFISWLPGSGTPRTHTCPFTNAFLIGKQFVLASNYPSKAVSHSLPKKRLADNFSLQHRKTTWLIGLVRVIVVIDHWGHVFAWRRRSESLVIVFTLYSGPDSWKTYIPLPVNENSLINNVTSMRF